MAEVEAIHAVGVANIFFVDDNFIGNKKEAKALLTALGDWQSTHGYPLEFMTEVSLNVAQDDELLALMKRARFTTIFVGIESPRRASLEESSKSQNTREDLITSVHRIQAAGIEVMAGMIVGFDSDDPQSSRSNSFHPAGADPDLDDGHAERDADGTASERLKRPGGSSPESGARPVRVHENRAGRHVALELYEGYRRLLGVCTPTATTAAVDGAHPESGALLGSRALPSART